MKWISLLVGILINSQVLASETRAQTGANATSNSDKVEASGRTLDGNKSTDADEDDDDEEENQAVAAVLKSEMAPTTATTAATAATAGAAVNGAGATPDLSLNPAKSESEIPVLTKGPNVTGSTKDSSLRLVMSLAIVFAVVGGLFFFAKYWAKRKFGIKTHHQIKVLTQHALGPKKNLAIIRVAGESILIGITDHNITMIKSLALLDEELPEDVPSQFDQELERVESGPEPAPRTSGPAFVVSTSKPKKEEGEEFSFGSVKDIVASRLREMRKL